MQIDYIIGNEEQMRRMTTIGAWKPFDSRVVDFCGEISKKLLLAENCQKYPDLVSLAFWLRRSNVQKISRDYADMENRLGRGLVFHIAPGNVALSFAYSLATGLLTGNTNILRLPSRKFEQADIFCEVLKQVLADYPEMAQRLCLIKYPHDKELTDELSMMCHTRIIWGGNDTIDVIRQSPIRPRTTEITFANRFSICLINADEYLDKYDSKKTAHDFYNDTYLTDQNACSSPRIIFWYGKEIQAAQKVFWEALHNEIQKYDMAPVTTVNKMLTFCKFAAENQCGLSIEKDYRIMRIGVDNIGPELLESIGNSGYFYECEIADIREILPICTWELQTLSYIGFDSDELCKTILDNAPYGVDRVVPVGNTMNFSFIWDGRDIVREMTRMISGQ